MSDRIKAMVAAALREDAAWRSAADSAKGFGPDGFDAEGFDNFFPECTNDEIQEAWNAYKAARASTR